MGIAIHKEVRTQYWMDLEVSDSYKILNCSLRSLEGILIDFLESIFQRSK